MLTIPLKPKYQSKAGISTGTINFDVPADWANFARMTDIRSGAKVIKFDPYPYQIGLIDLIENHFGTVIAKTRQLGISECIASYFLWKACKNPGYTAVVLSKGQTDTSNIAKRIRKMVLGLSAQGLLSLEAESMTDIQINGGGRIVFRPATPNSVRGLESVSDILFDECAFIDDIEQLYTATLPSTELLGDDARIILNSTPNGKQGFYWDRLTSDNNGRDVNQVCNDIRAGSLEPFHHWIDSTGWAKAFIHWKAHPFYGSQENYLEKIKTKKKLSENAVQREYNLSFDDSDITIFAYELIRDAAIGAYADYDPNLKYYLAVDTSTIGDDFTVGIVLSEDTNRRMNVAAMYRRQKAAMDVNLHHLGELIEKYQITKVGIEITGGTGQLYMERLAPKFPNVEFQAIRTTGDSKPLMIDRLVLALEKRLLTFPPGAISDELQVFRRSGENLRQMSAPEGCHDDTVMALAFGVTISSFARDTKVLEVKTYGNAA